MKHSTMLMLLGIIVFIAVCLFLFFQVGSNWQYILALRGAKVAAMILTGTAIAFSTLIFQTLTNNRILTPGIIGLDAMYVLIQTVIIFLFGSSSLIVINKPLNFFI